MGLFRRLRTGSTSAGASPASIEPSPVRPSSPTPKLHTTPTRPSVDILSRPSILPSPSSTSTNKVAKKSWGPSRWKGKGKEKDDTHAGTPYEEATPALGFNGGGDVGGKRDTMVFLGDRSLSTPAISPTSSSVSTWGRTEATPLPAEEKKKKSKKRKDRVNSGEFKQDGGILGRLGFESDLSKPKDATSTNNLQPKPDPLTEKDVNKEELAEEESAVIIDKEDVNYGAHNGSGRVREEMEVLESAEKKQRFWKGRIRRASRATSEMEEDLQPGSPTPRKTTFPTVLPEPSPTAKTSTELVHPRPQALRRPSSSLFHNPFNRSLSRASIAHDLDGAEDSSFQLKGFRHVSGIMDVEGAGGLEGYLTHVPRESMIGLDKPTRPVSPDPNSPVTPGNNARPPSAFGSAPRPRTGSRAQLSRPPSVAASLASVDDIITNSNRISAAAFRKGIRRPSEGPGATMSDIGHGTGAVLGDEDEDDQPLGMLKPRMRTQSSYSIASMRELYAKESPNLSNHPSPSPSPQPLSKPHSTSSSRSPSPQPIIMVKRRDKQSTPSFVVKSARSSRVSDTRPSTDYSGSGQKDGSQFSDAPMIPPTPSPLNVDNQELVQSPTALDGGGYFSSSAPAQTSVQPQNQASHSVTAPWFQVRENVREPSSTPPPILTDSPSPNRPTPPPVHPIDLPQPGDITPLDLPLPPDLMPDTPPRNYSPLPQSATTSPGTNRKKMSLLDEPLRVISGLFSPTSEDTVTNDVNDGFDPDLVLHSMAVLGENGVGDAKKEESVSRPISRATLFDARSIADAPRSGTPLHTKYDMATSDARPVIGQTSSGCNTSQTEEAFPGQKASHTKGQIVSPTESSFARQSAPRKTAQKKASTSYLRGKAAWSSSESEGDSETSTLSEGSRKSKGKGKASMPVVASPNRQITRKVPGGPRRASIASTQPLPPQMKAILQPDDGGSSSSEDEHLSVVRARASRSNLSVNKIVSPSTSNMSLPKAGSPGRSKLGNELNLNASTSSTGSSFRPSSNQRKSSRPSFSHTSPSSPTTQALRSPKSKSKSPPKTASRLANLSADQSSRASPESSLSTTSESLFQQPSTPRDSGNRSMSVADHMSLPGQWQNEEERHRSMSTAQQTWPQFDPSQSFPPGMDHASMVASMKQAWQAQFMAAAYRASEEEWDRASAVSGPSAPSSSPPMPMSMGMGMGMPYLPHMLGAPMSGYAYPQGMPMPHPQMGMGMPWMGYPSGFPYSSAASSSGSVYNLPTSQAGMYGYGTSSQSVFGGEFGPPSQTRSYHSYPQQTNDSHSVYETPSAKRTDNNGPSDRQSPGYRGHARKFSETSQQQPPSSWRRSSGGLPGSPGDGQWDDAPTPRKMRPATQLIN